MADVDADCGGMGRASAGGWVVVAVVVVVDLPFRQVVFCSYARYGMEWTWDGVDWTGVDGVDWTGVDWTGH